MEMLTDAEYKFVTEIGETILRQLKSNPIFKFWGCKKPGYVPIRRDGILYGALEFWIETEKYPNDCLVRVIYYTPTNT